MKVKYHEGIFYPSDRAELDKLINRPEEKETAKAIIVPHASLPLVSALLGKAFTHVGTPERIIILSPIHSGRTESDSGYAFFEGDENKDIKLVYLGAKKSEWYAEEEPGAEILLPYIEKYAPSSSVAIIYTDIKTAAESKALSAFLKEHKTPDTLFIISTNLSAVERTMEEAESWGKSGVEALVNGENILDLYNRNKVRLCARGALDSINRIVEGKWKLEAEENSNCVYRAVLWK